MKKLIATLSLLILFAFKTDAAFAVKLTSITLDPENASGATTNAPGAWSTNPGDPLSQIGVAQNGIFLNSPGPGFSLGDVSLDLKPGVNTFDLYGNNLFPGNLYYGAVLFFDNAATPPQVAVFNNNSGSGNFSIQSAGTTIMGGANGGSFFDVAPGTSRYTAPDGTTVDVTEFTINSLLSTTDLVSYYNIGANGIPDTVARLSLFVDTHQPTPTSTPPPPYTITVQKSGNGTGTITSNPSGINCSSTCNATFSGGTSVTLTATDGDESIFTGWSGGGCNGTSTCTPTQNTNSIITASFVVKTYFVSGKVTDVRYATGFSGATIIANPGNKTAITDGNGNYTINGLVKGNYTIKPSRSNFEFSPISRLITVSSNTPNVNFITGATFSVSGRTVDENNNAIPNVRIITDSGQSIVSGSDGSFKFNVMSGKRTFIATKTGYTFPIVYSTVMEIITKLIIHGYNKPPVVFVHGWGANFEDTFKASYQPDIPTQLEHAGYHTEAANLYTTYAYTPKLQDNIPRLVEAIDRAKIATGQPKVIIIAHSMGGLVSRAYIESAGFRHDVSTLYTLGTLHKGTPLAVFSFLNGLAKGPAIAQMTPEGMLSFNLAYHKPADVEYHVIGGDAPMDAFIRHNCLKIFGWTVACWDEWKPIWVSNPDLRNFWGWLLGNIIPGQDDSFVSTDSATGHVTWIVIGRAGFFPILIQNGLTSLIDRAATDELHAKFFGDVTYVIRHNDLSRTYFQCIKKILVDKVTNTCGTWSTSERTPMPMLTAAKMQATNTANGTVTPSQTIQDTPPSLEQHTPFITGTLKAGKKKTYTISVEGGATSFSVHWTNGSITFTLVDPEGKKIDPDFVTNHSNIVTYGGGENTAVYYFPQADYGSWKLVLEGGQGIPNEGTSYTIYTNMQSTLTMSSHTDKLWYAQGETATITTSFSEVPSIATVTATMVYADKSSKTITLLPNDQGQYVGNVAVSNIPGYVQVDIAANGVKEDDSPFERGNELQLQVTPQRDSITGAYTDTADPRENDASLYQSLSVLVGVSSTIDGKISIAANLSDADGNVITHSLAEQTVTAGNNTIVLHFPSKDIFAAQKNGPFYMTNLLLIDNREENLVEAFVPDAYTTGSYDYKLFAEDHNSPTISAGGPYSVKEKDSLTLTATGVDPQNDDLTYAWDLDDDGVFETPGQSVDFPTQGISAPYATHVRVQVINSTGYAAVDETTVDVVRMIPVVNLEHNATIKPGDTFSQSGSFDAMDTHTYTATVDYGDGSGEHSLALSGFTFSLSHVYTDIDKYSVTVTITDHEGNKGTGNMIVTVSKSRGDMDGDGVLDSDDMCPASNMSSTVVIGNCDSKVSNTLDTNGCTISDYVLACANDNNFDKCVKKLGKKLKKEDIISNNDKNDIKQCLKQ